MTSHQFHFRSCAQQHLSPLQVAGSLHTQRYFQTRTAVPFVPHSCHSGVCWEHACHYMSSHTLQGVATGGEASLVLPSSPALGIADGHQAMGCVSLSSAPSASDGAFRQRPCVINNEFQIMYSLRRKRLASDPYHWFEEIIDFMELKDGEKQQLKRVWRRQRCISV